MLSECASSEGIVSESTPTDCDETNGTTINGNASNGETAEGTRPAPNVPFSTRFSASRRYPSGSSTRAPGTPQSTPARTPSTRSSPVLGSLNALRFRVVLRSLDESRGAVGDADKAQDTQEKGVRGAGDQQGQKPEQTEDGAQQNPRCPPVLLTDAGPSGLASRLWEATAGLPLRARSGSRVPGRSTARRIR